MRRPWLKILCAALAMAGVVVAGSMGGSLAANRTVTIGTAGIAGVYYPAGGAICRMVNRGRKEHGIRCSVQSTGGSIYNINAIRHGELELGAAQSDWQYHAYYGSDIFADRGAFSELRSLFSLYGEPFTIVARQDAGIASLDDLAGKRINIGNPGSGQHSTMEAIMAKKGWNKQSFAQISELDDTAQQIAALCDRKIDAFVYTVGHPNRLVREASTACDTVIVPITGPAVDALIAEYPYYSKTIIPGGMYAGTPQDVETFGMKATFVSSGTVDPSLIYEVVKAVFDNFDNFKTLHPVFSTLDKKQMIANGNTAPLHEGALRYYREAGLAE